MFSDYKYPGGNSSGGSEPMNLGSPISSPTRHNISYLPPYLIRETPTHIPSTSPSIGNWNSPIAKHQPDSFLLSHRSPSVPRKVLYQSPAPSPVAQVLNSPSVAKPGGPPVQGLFDGVSSPRMTGLEYTKLDETPKTPLLRARENGHPNGVLTPNRSFSHNASSFMSPAQIDPFYTQGESLTSETQLDETWVTIFGFPPAATNYILQQFSNYGKIIERRLETKGNWIHVRFQSKLQAKKALSKNGKIFGDSIMVGVKACIEVDLMNESAKENSEAELSDANFCLDSFDLESLDSSKRSMKNIRPLTQIYKTPTSDVEVTPTIQPKVNSLVSKAIGYVLKW